MTASAGGPSASRRGPALLCLVLAFAGTVAAADPVAPGPAAGVLLRALREAEGAVQRAAEAAAQIARRRRSPEYAEAWKEEAGEGIEASAAVAIATARGRIERGKNLGQVRDLEEASRLATGARKDLEALAGRLDQLRARQAVRDLLIRNELSRAREKAAVEKAPVERAAAAKAAADKAAAAKAAADKAAADKAAADKAAADKAAAERAAAEKAAADRLAAEQERADRQAREQETARREAESRDRPQPRHLPQKIDSRQPGPPSELRAAAHALFHADYEEVVHSLAGANFAERRAAVTASLLLAAARYSLYLQGGGKDLQLRRQAGEDVRTCRRLAPALSPDPKLFSPRFMQFFRSAG
jgi:hypothetical protein